MTSKLRLVIFTSGAIAGANRVLFERLARDPLFEVAGIVVDEYRAPRKPLVTRIIRALREDGAGWIAFKFRTVLQRAMERRIARAADRIHGPRRSAEKTLDIPVHRVADIHSPDSLALIRSLSPDLGVIAGTRILRDAVITIPTLGTLNVHKLKLPKFRGGGPPGYWEILAGEKSIGVSIHWAVSQVDAGAIVAHSEIPIEPADTLESLKLKADIRGVQLYHDALRRIAAGESTGVAQDLPLGTTHRAPSEYKVWKLQRELERRAARIMSAPDDSLLRRFRVAVQYLSLLPRLLRARARLIRDGRAPVSIFFYHLVADSPLNHMCMPLPAFVRQIEFLRRYYPILPLGETVARLQSGSNSEVAASITFDDGYRANAWAIEYLRLHDIPAAFFVSIGHVRDGSLFEHDERRGHDAALPMTVEDVRNLAANGFVVGSHGIHHEDFGAMTTMSAARILRESRDLIAEECGKAPDMFAFPKGKRGTNITTPTLALALENYASVFSAYGGWSYPESGRRHFLRMSAPATVFDLSLSMTGYNGFRATLGGDGWGLRTARLDPATDRSEPARGRRIALIAASPDIIGGHSTQAQALAADLRNSGHEVTFIPIDPRFPRGLRWIRRIPYMRTLLNQSLYVPSLRRIRGADVVHVFSASYWSFVLAPVPAILAAKLSGKPVVLHYHSGEADDHLTRWRTFVRPFLRLTSEIVVPSDYLRRVFAAHGYRARVIPNLIDTSHFSYRERRRVRPRLLSVRNLESYYDVENTVAAFAHVKTRFPDATLTVAGHGTHERGLRQLAAQLGVDGIRFLGRTDPSLLPAIYEDADIFVNSSVLDNQPVSILEAFAAGLPVVSTPAGDIPSMLQEGEAGMLVNARTPCDITDAVTRLVEEPGLALALARRARKEVDRYTWRHVGEQWTGLYESLRNRK